MRPDEEQKRKNQREYSAKYYQENKESIKKRKAKYYQENRKRIDAAGRKYCTENIEKVRERRERRRKYHRRLVTQEGLIGDTGEGTTCNSSPPVP